MAMGYSTTCRNACGQRHTENFLQSHDQTFNMEESGGLVITDLESFKVNRDP